MLLSALLAGVACTSLSPSDDRRASGLVVEKVKAGSDVAAAGVQVGDVLLSWRRGDVGGELVSPFDLDQVRVEEAPRGAVTLSGRRGEAAASFTLAEGDWDLEARPRLGPEAATGLAGARELRGAGVERLRALASSEQRPAVRAWLLVLAAEAAGLEAGAELWAEAVASADSAPTRAWVCDRHGKALRAASRFDEAVAVFTRTLDVTPPESLAAARLLNTLGNIAGIRGDLEACERQHRRALEVRGRVAPDSLAVAASLANLGVVAVKRGNLEVGEGYYRRALAIQERLGPSTVAYALGLSNLGTVARYRGDLEAAESWLRRALAIQVRVAPDSLEVARTLNSLGAVAVGRGDLEGADESCRRALAIQESIAPDSLEVAGTLNNLGAAFGELGDPAAGEPHLRRALAIQEHLAPDSIQVVASLISLGVVVAKRGDIEGAESLFLRALAIQQRVAAGSLDLALNLRNLGKLARDRGDLDASESLLKRALQIQERLAPESAYEARSLHELARTLRAGDRRAEAIDALRRAVAGLEAQQRRLGGTPEQLGEFRSQYLGIYRDLVDLLLEEGRSEEAFSVLESARARALLALLAERDLVTHDVPPELEQERKLANADHDRAMAALGELSETDEEERAGLIVRLDAVRHRQDEIRARVRSASQRLAELRYPEPLDLGAARQTLEDGTLLLELALGEERSHLFAVGPGAERFAVYPLAVSEGTLREQVTQLRRLIELGRLDPALLAYTSSREALTRVSRSLSETLLGPVRDQIAACSRVIVVPDGPLHVLPFAALLDPTGGYERLMVESKPVSVVASATVLAQLAKQRRTQKDTQLVAFGDPSYTVTTSGEVHPALEKVGRRGLSLDPLPATRLELEGLGGLFGENATLWLGAEATEERAKGVGQGVTVVHFAAHGMVDERRPLSSALALTIPAQVVEGQDNGLLQAWEVFEQVRLDADLVVLSACDTALGKEVAGEGILGLTRAFQYAGARSVLASLWAVADESTAKLMLRFYANLKSGLAKDEALRQAQLAFIRGPLAVGEGEQRVDRDLSHPFFWAAFELVGDWR